ncbi:HAMP domain-containing sensor histidine kinase [Flavobacterium sp. DG1-102-2]|uniref:sensor histidine kinase n=1 Tax=Flavobacterium sp. DG1-102-2 TaxID=3081663 RepID=UPI0029492A72|nr:HAMP domain-containing sensor histidine kinase [Flavobacterium sp. DG1-102-2]MDV6168870.1 HAMP domain-containing sensor histidine kinase [Flavobacterium sp. DG1-102-2]
MKRKIAFLITGCILTVVALAIIQAYFIYNTYLLKAKEANAAITEELLEIETTGKLDTLNACWMGKTKSFINGYYDHKGTKEEYKNLIKKVSDSLSAVMSGYINKNAIFEEYEVSYINYLQSVVVYRNKIPDTLFKGKMVLYGNNTAHADETAASQSTWRDKTDDTDINSLQGYGLEVVSQRYYSIANWEHQIYIKMIGLLIFSVLLLSFVVILFYLSIKNLITQKKIAEIKTDFINNITHEFQTPLAAMDIAVKTLRKKDDGLTAEHLNLSLDIIDRQNIRMQKLFAQVSEASLTNGEITPITAEPLQNSSLEEILNDFKLSHPGVVIKQTDTAASLHIDRFHFSTILINLLDNAVKYNANVITLTLTTKGNGTIVSVKDNGMGIPKKEQKAIFEKFYRVQKGNVHTTKGLGLGLYYVQQVVKAYNGNITVNSGEGDGSEFVILIPQP